MDSSGISNLFEDSIQLSPNDISFTLNPGEVDEPQETNQVLLGKIINRCKFGKAAIQGSLNLSWKAVKGWKWKEIEDGLLQFTFARREDATNVLARKPWFGAVRSWCSCPCPPGSHQQRSVLTKLRCGLMWRVYHPSTGTFLIFRRWLPRPHRSTNYPQELKMLWDQSSCFKAPTVVKDSLGNFYPLYGTWLWNDVKEKSTFTTPLAKWFQDWVLQKRLGKDPVLRNQVKVQKAIRNGEEAEMREIFPFGQNSKQVNVQELIDAATPSEGKKTKMFTIKGSNSKGNNLLTKQDNDIAMIKEDLTISVGNNRKPLERGIQSNHLEKKRASASSSSIDANTTTI
uniref:DUF4283 domain-containing protein n=1 Tax=Cannabis sativa TaxID=3483 RepID=A0A803QBR3_CANSA